MGTGLLGRLSSEAQKKERSPCKCLLCRNRCTVSGYTSVISVAQIDFFFFFPHRKVKKEGKEGKMCGSTSAISDGIFQIENPGKAQVMDIYRFRIHVTATHATWCTHFTTIRIPHLIRLKYHEPSVEQPYSVSPSLPPSA